MADVVTLAQLGRQLGTEVHAVALEPSGEGAPPWLCAHCVAAGWVLWRNAGGQLRISQRGAEPERDAGGKAVVGCRPEVGDECSSCAISGLAVWSGERWLRLRDGRLVEGDVGCETGVDVSDVAVDETLVRRAAVARMGVLAVDVHGRLINTWSPTEHGFEGPARLIWVR